MLSFKKMRPPQKLIASERVGSQSWLRVITIVVCKRYLEDSLPTPDLRYLYTFRLLLERLSWMAEQRREIADYTLAHITGFKKEALVAYDLRLREMDTAINWRWLAPDCGAVDQPKRISALQLADTAASSVGAAFNPHQRTGEVNLQYVQNITSRLWVPADRNLTSYGLKMHPWVDATKAAYPWVTALVAGV